MKHYIVSLFHQLSPHPRTLVACTAALLFGADRLPAETVSAWTRDQGTAGISGQNTATVTLGNNTNNNANGVYVSGALSGSLAVTNVGDSIQMTGTMSVTGVSQGNISNSLTFGLYDRNASTAAGWLGYTVGNGDTSHLGLLLERNVGNTSIYGSTTGATQIFSALASGNAASGSYTFGLTLTRMAANSLSIAYSLTGPNYAMTGNFTDTAVNSFAFDRVGFISDGSGADQFSLSNVNVTLTQVPEPGMGSLLAIGALGWATRRRVRARSSSGG